jgi:hypothetical protein
MNIRMEQAKVHKEPILRVKLLPLDRLNAGFFFTY